MSINPGLEQDPDGAEGPMDGGASPVPGTHDGGADGGAGEGPADSGAGPSEPDEHDGGADGGADGTGGPLVV